MKDKRYNIIYNDIISKIRSGEYKVGEKIPNESELMKKYNVSRTTTTRALKSLADINLIYRVKKAGTFVNGKLGNNTSLIIPVILHNDENDNDIMKGIQSMSLNNNIFTPFYNSKNNIQKERDCLLKINQYNFDGLIVFPCQLAHTNLDLYIEILKRGIPIVCLDRNILGLNTPLVTTDNTKGVIQMITRLVELGHRKIGFFSINDQMAITETERFKGYCAGIIENKLPFDTRYIFNTHDIRKKEINITLKQQKELFYEYIKQNFQEYLALEDKPTAICCVNDITLEALKIASAYNIKLPEELMLATFDAPTETTRQQGFLNYVQDNLRLGKTVISLMLKILNGEPYSMVEYVDGFLIE